MFVAFQKFPEDMEYYINYVQTKANWCECGEVINVGELLVELRTSHLYHFRCFFENCHGRCKKSKIMIERKESPNERHNRYVSLSDLDKNPAKYDLAVNEEDVERIRKNFALLKEQKTPCFIPCIPEEIPTTKCCVPDFVPSHSTFVQKPILRFQGKTYHPLCLSKTAKVNVNSDEINGYDKLEDDEKRLLDELFKNNDEVYNFPQAQPKQYGTHDFCAYCSKDIVKLRIRYQTKAYHCNCFNKMGKFNLDGNEFGNYDSLSAKSQKILDKEFKKSDDFDTPEIKTAGNYSYCKFSDCFAANGKPSKFPWPYTVIPGELRIWYKGGIFHPQCFRSSGYGDTEIQNFKDYDNCSEEEKELLNGIFASQNRDESSDGGNQESGDYSEGPPAKKRRLSESVESFDNNSENPMEEDLDRHDNDNDENDNNRHLENENHDFDDIMLDDADEVIADDTTVNAGGETNQLNIPENNETDTNDVTVLFNTVNEENQLESSHVCNGSEIPPDLNESEYGRSMYSENSRDAFQTGNVHDTIFPEPLASELDDDDLDYRIARHGTHNYDYFLIACIMASLAYLTTGVICFWLFFNHF